MKTFQQFFNIAGFWGLITGFAIRLLGLDFAILTNWEWREWQLLDLHIIGAPGILFMGSMGPLTLYIGRNNALYAKAGPPPEVDE